jgi:hypothetical protein
MWWPPFWSIDNHKKDWWFRISYSIIGNYLSSTFNCVLHFEMCFSYNILYQIIGNWIFLARVYCVYKAVQHGDEFYVLTAVTMKIMVFGI